MGVVTVIGEEGVQVLVEFVGGPRNGKRSLAIATTDREGKPIPPSAFTSAGIADDAAVAPAADAVAVGKYVCEGYTRDGEAYNYVWRTVPAGAPEDVAVDTAVDAAAPDLAARIRLAYARRASSRDGQAEEPQRSGIFRRGTANRPGA
jgi:hypothetical protein